MDLDKSGDVTFVEVLQAVFPVASRQQIKVGTPNSIQPWCLWLSRTVSIFSTRLNTTPPLLCLRFSAGVLPLLHCAVVACVALDAEHVGVQRKNVACGKEEGGT